MLEVTDGLTIPEAEWTWAYARSGGPDIQQANNARC